MNDILKKARFTFIVLFFLMIFAVPLLGIIWIGLGAVIAGVFIIGGLILLQLPIYWMLRKSLQSEQQTPDETRL
ncbi:MAG: hypothetical protein SGJ20_12400 [Planctomycetota bacterium]|nr:hypothetical protein [Planctomycetota bacterium]